MAFGDSVGTFDLASLASGTVFVAGSLGVVDVPNIADATLAASGPINRLTLGTVNSSNILSGANLGATGLLGAGDTFSAGSINLLNVQGAMTDSFVAVGVSPGLDGVFGDSDDVLSGGGKVNRTILDLGADPTSRIEAGAFGTAKVAPWNSLSRATRLAPPTADPTFVIP